MNKEQKVERIVAEVPQTLKRRAAAKAALQGKHIKDAVIEALEMWLAEDEVVMEQARKTAA